MDTDPGSVLLHKKLAEMVRWVLGANGVELKGDWQGNTDS